ncbi:hypothetical protein Droror1_Dr00006798 [Drosera rotundifolia]
MSQTAKLLLHSPLSAVAGNSPSLDSTYRLSSPISRWRLGGNGDARLSTPKAQGHGLLVSAKDNVFLAKGTKKEVIMVDPLEAKRIAAREMEEIRAREEFERKRRGEALNGALAMIGLTASLVIEGQTGKGIVGQLYGYVKSIISYVLGIYPEDLLDGKIPSYTELNLFQKFPSYTEFNLFEKFSPFTELHLFEKFP